MKKTLIVGAFGFNVNDTGGQPVKTRELYYALKEKFKEEDIDYIETIGWKKHPFSLALDFFKKAKSSKNIIMLPAQRGVKVFSRLLVLSKRIYKNKIFYDVIGGWLGDKLSKHKKLKNILLKFDGIWVETTIMKDALNKQGLDNIYVVRNFKNLKPVTNNIKIDDNSLKLCTFSRVMKIKGISDAIYVVTKLNKEGLDIKLDIYGHISDDYVNEFEELRKNFDEKIRYMGEAKPSKSVNILINYNLLLFPTRYLGEGLPGTIIDAYFAGLPVLSAKWPSYNDIVIEGITGIGFEMFNIKDLEDKLKYIYNNKYLLKEMSGNCLTKAQEFSKDKVVEQIINYLI